MRPKRMEKVCTSKKPVLALWSLVDAVEMVTANRESKISWGPRDI